MHSGHTSIVIRHFIVFFLWHFSRNFEWEKDWNGLTFNKSQPWLLLLQKFSSEQQKDVEVPPPSKLSAFEPLTRSIVQEGAAEKNLVCGVVKGFCWWHPWRFHGTLPVPYASRSRNLTVPRLGRIEKVDRPPDISRNPKIPKRCCT